MAKRKKPMDKAEPIKHHYTDPCVSFWNLITSKPRWMSVTDIERQDKSKHNEERARNQKSEYKRILNKVVEDRGTSKEQAELLYLQEVGKFETASVTYQYKCGEPLLKTQSECNDLPTNMR
jgi:hypothetical protein